MDTERRHIDAYERNWMIFSFVLLALFAIAVSVAAFGMGIQVPAPEQRVDPRTVATDPNSPWSNPGLREIAPGKYDAYILARAVPQWEYLPRICTVPAGSSVSFYLLHPLMFNMASRSRTPMPILWCCQGRSPN